MKKILREKSIRTHNRPEEKIVSHRDYRQRGVEYGKDGRESTLSQLKKNRQSLTTKYIEEGQVVWGTYGGGIGGGGG